jgi:hypothetical protein
LLETGRVIAAYANGLKLAGAGSAAACLHAIAELFGEFPDRTMNDFIVCCRKVQTEPGSGSDESIAAEIVPHLEALKNTLTAGGLPQARTKDLGLLINLLQNVNYDRGESHYLLPMLRVLRRALTPQTPEDAVREFIDRLEAAKGSAEFERILSELQSSKLKKEHVVEIARMVYGGLPKGLSRKAALAYIRKPHDAYMSAKRGIDATGGRSAA